MPDIANPDTIEEGRAAEAPFLVEHRQEDLKPNGTFRPAARLVLTPTLRTGGLWHALMPEDFKNLLLLLTFLTPNGWCRPTLPELSAAMRVSRAKARTRMLRLAGTQWQGQPLANVLTRPDGLDAFLPGRHLIAHEETPVSEAAPTGASYKAAGREAVVAHSRARYARTRAEVEAQIGGMMGWDKRMEGGPFAFAGADPAVAEGKRKAFQAMTAAGLPKDQALDLLSRFDLGAVERQIAWLPQRNAKNPARFLAAAIEGGYDRPLSLRREAGPVGGGNGGEGASDAEDRIEGKEEEGGPGSHTLTR